MRGLDNPRPMQARRMHSLLDPSRDAGLRRLADFTPRARDYARLRNFDKGPGRHAHVSGLSPYLRHRLITEEEVLGTLLHEHPCSAVEKFVQEVFWRGYFKGHLESHPESWFRYCAERDAGIANLAHDHPLAQRYQRAIEGRCGIDALDAWVRELRDTGYLHNHARMWFASIWIFTLQLPWTLGADFMYRHLLDGDPASNTLSWRWVAGLHTTGKAYLARAENIERFTQGRFQPAGLAKHAVALTEPASPCARAPIVQSPQPWEGTAALLLSEDDLDAESLWAESGSPSGTHPAAVAALAPALAEVSPQPIAPAVAAFKQTALQQAAHRAATSFGAVPRLYAYADGAALADWAQSLRIQTIVLPYAPVGPTKDQRSALMKSLYERGIRTREIIRRYDRLVWPHAGRGFFKLKATIPSILRELGLSEIGVDRRLDPLEPHRA